VPVTRKSRAWIKNEAGEFELVEKVETVPASFRVDPWNLYPAGDCGESIHNGSYIFECDKASAKVLGALKGGQGPAKYLDDQIDAVL
jgi:hypothetical protein